MPNKLPNVTLYSHVQAGKDFQKMDRDIYLQQSKCTPYSDKKTPKSLWVLLGLGGSFGVYKLVKYLMKK